MKRIGVIPLIIIMFIGPLLAPIPHVSAQAVSIATDQPFYPFWKVGGTVKITASDLTLNTTYYFWLQRPKSTNTTLTGSKIQGVATTTVQLTIASSDPSGTYRLSLSRSNLIDTREAVLNFGVCGTDRAGYQRTERIIIAGGGFSPNSTISVELRNITSLIEGFPAAINATTRGDYNYTYKIPISGTIGVLTVKITGTTFDDQKLASASVDVQIEEAVMRFKVRFPQAIERTTLLNVSVIVTYPDGSLLTSNTSGAVVNVTLSATNFTRAQLMSYNESTLSWSGQFPIAVNASLGQYALAIGTIDAYGNSGKVTSSSAVIPARLRFTVGAGIKTDPSKLVDVSVYVKYPNGTNLTDRLGGQVIAYTNSSGLAAYAMTYDGTDGKWHVLYRSPELGFNFGKTVNIYFNATDQYGNAGSAQKSFNIQVGADMTTVILSVVAAAIVPAVLLVWAILTISGRRRKYKP